ncbi:NAD(P)-binding domain-containing protein [Streptomyces massasporeus]|uniref:NAD(P)-binding domain-containing protein n=1 Tax=Streptomyces massasporeus TaxID=67324 RepID=UPI00345178D6
MDKGFSMAHASTVAVLGAGALGATMATRLGDGGHEVRLWNRTEDRARAVADGAGRIAAVGVVGGAVSGSSVVITVLRDGDAVAEVMSDAIDRLDEDAVWVQASTVGPRSAGALAGLARDHGVAYLDAPVSGSPRPHDRANRLAGRRHRGRPREGATSPRRSWLVRTPRRDATEGSAVKLAVNAWMAASTVAMSAVLALCDALGVDHATFVRVLEAGPLAMPYELQNSRPHGRRLLRARIRCNSP